MTLDAWEGFMSLVDSGSIKPVIYPTEYRGLEELPKALEDLRSKKVWGRAILRINEDAEAAGKARL